MRPNVCKCFLFRSAAFTWVTLLVLSVYPSTALAQNERSAAPFTTTEIARLAIPTVVSITTPTGQGSGVIIEPSGVIVTNLHVIQGETQIKITLHNSDVYDDVAVVDFDERRDLVLLKIKAFNLRIATLGNSEEVNIGEDVVLVGSPQGFDSTVSKGVISAIRDSGNGFRLIQTSAPASPGSSGGGMFNTFGELIGIVTSQTNEGENLNFAVPVNYVRGLISTKATMSLTDLTERTLSSSNQSLDRTTSEDTEEGESTDTSKLSAIIENLKTIDTVDRYFELVDFGDGQWLASYKNAKNYDKLIISIAPISDEFDESMVWIRCWIPGFDAELTAPQLKDMLELSYRLNLSKIVIDDDGDILASAEADLRVLDSYGLFRVLFAVAISADQLAGELK